MWPPAYGSLSWRLSEFARGIGHTDENAEHSRSRPKGAPGRDKPGPYGRYRDGGRARLVGLVAHPCGASAY